MQHELEVTTKQPVFVDSSISDTIRTCIVLGNHRAALKIKTEFKFPIRITRAQVITNSLKTWYWLKVFALATIREWDALEKFSKQKRPPIDEKGEALKYIPKLADPREKASG